MSKFTLKICFEKFNLHKQELNRPGFSDEGIFIFVYFLRYRFDPRELCWPTEDDPDDNLNAHDWLLMQTVDYLKFEPAADEFLRKWRTVVRDQEEMMDAGYLWSLLQGLMYDVSYSMEYLWARYAWDHGFYLTWWAKTHGDILSLVKEDKNTQ